MAETQPSILLIQLRQIGDVLMTSPAVARLRESFPKSKITFLTESPSHQVYVGNPHVDEVLKWPGKGSVWERLKLGWQLRKQRFDLVIDFMSGPQSAQITWMVGAPVRLGFEFPGRKWAYTKTLPLPNSDYSSDHKMGLLSMLDIPVEQGMLPQVFPNQEERAYAKKQLVDLGVEPDDLLVMISPVSRRPYKVWPAERFARIADVLVERYGAKILFQWGPGEEHFVDEVRLKMHHPALPTYPIPTLMQMAAMMEQAHLFIGNDNGPRHFAIASGLPTLAVFGRPWAASWTPPNNPLHIGIEHDPGCKANCTYPKCELDCINGVDFKTVEQAAEKLLEDILKDGSPIRRESTY